MNRHSSIAVEIKRFKESIVHLAVLAQVVVRKVAKFLHRGAVRCGREIRQRASDSGVFLQTTLV